MRGREKEVYNSEKREDNYLALAELDFNLAMDLFLLFVILGERGIPMKALVRQSHKHKTYVKGIIDAEPNPYGRQRLKAPNKFLAWLSEGMLLLDLAATEISDAGASLAS